MVGQIRILVLVALIALINSEGKAACILSKEQEGTATLFLPEATAGTVFSKHVFGQNQEIMEALGTGRNKKQIAANLRQVLKNQSQLINSLESDQLYFKKKLAREDIKWWGIEASPMEMKTGLSMEDQAQDLQEMKRQLRKCGLSNIETSQLLTLLYPPPVVLLAQFPEIVSKVKFVPLDDDKAKLDSFQLVEKMDQQRQELIRLGREKGLLSASQFLAIDNLSSRAKATNQLLTQPEIESSLSGLKNSKARETAQALLKNTNAFLMLSDRRDASAANAISRQSSAGLVLMGANHAHGVIEKTLAQCRHSSTMAPGAEAPRGSAK